MPYSYKDGILHVDEVPLEDIASRFGTPVFVYSWSDIKTIYERMQSRLQDARGQIYYAVKANSNLSVIHRLAELGAGFDIVSGGELERVLMAGGAPEKTLFSGVGKTQAEISLAVKLGIKAFSVESESELQRIQSVAKNLAIRANLVLRVNPDIPIESHPYITTGLKENKFGMPLKQVERLYQEFGSDPWLNICGLSSHLGSQISSVEPYLIALENLLQLKARLSSKGFAVEMLDLGGGFGITYSEETPFEFGSFIERAFKLLKDEDIEIGIEPGRSLVAESGTLLTRVEYLKPAVEKDYKNFVVVDAAMNDLIRPPLYSAYHQIDPVVQQASQDEAREWDVVGPVCETGDFLGKGRRLCLEEGSLLAIRDAGAYAFTMSSNYNSRMRCAEVLVEGNQISLIRERESFQDLIQNERIV